ncbi:MAG: thrombospondin type 3 repeat-containing protein [Candidatus Thermoplasmatota archaeon]|nr:thrombospondin type 3 repeat-containing protein [Candidatus Thermoplasmatota archaeon]
MSDRPNYLANSLLFAVIFALLLQPISGIGSTYSSGEELSDKTVISHAAQNEWTQSAGMDSGGLAAIVWPSTMGVDSAGDVLVGGMLIGDALFGSHASSSDAWGTGSPGQVAYIAKADGSSGTWQWLTETGEYGGGGYAMVSGIASHGTDVYICGWFNGNVTFGSDQYRSTQDTTDAFVSKINGNGQFQWTAVAGGATDDDSCEDITVDSSGNVFATGSFNGTANFNSNSVSTSGKMDIWVAQVSTAQVTTGGNRWSWIYTAGGPEEDYGSCIAVDGNNVFGCGWFSGTATFGNQQTQAAGQLASYIVKLTKGGSHVDVASVGATNGVVQIMDMVADSGTVYATGHTIGNAQFGTQQVGGAGANDRIIFVAELGSNNQWSWATGSTSGAYQTARSIDMTGQGALAIAGSFASVDSDGYLASSGSASFGTTTLSSTYLGMVIAGIDTSGNWLWAEVADGSYNDEGYGIAVMPTGSIVSMGDHCRGGVTASGQTCSITLGTGSESTNGNYFSDPNTNGGSYAFNTGIHLWAIQADSDGDGVGNVDDNCPSTPNADQSDIDVDNIGDVCDDDLDGDGKFNEYDDCDGPETNWDTTDVSIDMDQDGCLDATEDSDDDDDGVDDSNDPCTGVNFKQQWSSNSANDHDSDGCHDSEEDDDDDNDGVNDADDDCLRGWHNWTANSMTDHDGDGCKDGGEDDDDDNDGLNDRDTMNQILDKCPTGELGWTSDETNDRDGDGCRDDTEDNDDDGDEVSDTNDNCSPGPNGWALDWVSVPSTDLDGDGCRDLDEDDDDDGDGIDDSSDACPRGATGWVSDFISDRDGDGCRDMDEDTDDDGDGFLDIDDNCPNGETGWISTPENDWDRDGCKDDTEDNDDDQDSVTDDVDQCPNTPLGEDINVVGCGWMTQQDTDGDGVWDHLDNCQSTPSASTREMYNETHGFDVDEIGCWVGESDSDDDGKLLYLDDCPNTPEIYRTQTSIDGCHVSEYDIDLDGVPGDLVTPNGADQCPFTSNESTRLLHSTFGDVDSFGCWSGDDDSDSDGIRLYQDMCLDTPDDEEVLTEGDLMGCSASQRDEDTDGVKTSIDVCPDTPEGESVETSGEYAGCSLDERVNLGDTSAVLQKNMIFIIIGLVLVLGIIAMATVLVIRKNGQSPAPQASWDQPMVPVDFTAAPATPVAPQVLSDYTQLPGGGGYSTGAMGETIYNAPDGSNWQMQTDGSFIRIN